jgi:hypothetical protein
MISLSNYRALDDSGSSYGTIDREGDVVRWTLTLQLPAIGTSLKLITPVASFTGTVLGPQIVVPYASMVTFRTLIFFALLATAFHGKLPGISLYIRPS